MGTFDLNLARVLVLVHETGSVTATAETLHVTQPTVSYSLGKLRRHFDDELFRRNGRGLTPTAGARRLYESLQRALGEIDGTVRQGDVFAPGTTPGRFTTALSDLGEATLLPRLLAAHERAPGASFTVRPFDVEDAESQLRRGDLDTFVASPVITSHLTVRVPLFRERYVLWPGRTIRASGATRPHWRTSRPSTTRRSSGRADTSRRAPYWPPTDCWSASPWTQPVSRCCPTG